MKKDVTLQKSILLTVLILSLSFVLSLLMQKVIFIDEHVTTLFVFAVFLISLVTNGYLFGVASAVISMLLVNYAFTTPFFTLNFTIRENLFSAVVMITIAATISTISMLAVMQNSAAVDCGNTKLSSSGFAPMLAKSI